MIATPAAKWPWLTKVEVAQLALIAAFFLGLLSFAAVSKPTVRCREEPIYLRTESGNRLTLEDGVTNLIAVEKHTSCRLDLGYGYSLTILP